MGGENIMNDNLFCIGISNSIIIATYHRLINLCYADMDDSDEYNDLIEKLKSYVTVENEYYLNLTAEELNRYFELIGNTTKFSNHFDARIYTRMNETKKKYEGTPVIDGNILLSSIISSKITIDVLKGVERKINALGESDEFDSQDMLMMHMYSKRYKLHYLTTNFFIERLALEHNFDIEALPTYTYQDIEKRFGVRFINNIQNNFCDYVISSLDELANLNTDDKYLLIYTKFFEIARIEAMLPYLNLESLNKITTFITDHSIKYDSNSALVKVRKIIDKRKEEFNK